MTSTEHEILIQSFKQGHTFVINPACSMTKLEEADLPPENNTNYGFHLRKYYFIIHNIKKLIVL